MPFLYFGKTSLYKGKPLFKILGHLKDFGRGRIVYRTIDYYDYPNEISFYRILYAQPEMDEQTLHGRVVAERIFRNRRRKEPHIISDIAFKPDFRLVPKDEEEAFCQWDQILDYDPVRDAPSKPKFMDMPPLLKEVIRRRKIQRGEKLEEDFFKLPAHKIYEGDFNLLDKVQGNNMNQYLDEHHSNYQNFDVNSIPESIKYERFHGGHTIGHKLYDGFLEGKGWEKTKEKLEAKAKFE